MIHENTRIERVTPRENPAVNGPWICNKGRDLAQVFERPRAEQALQKGRPTDLAAAVAVARKLIVAAKAPVALISNWASNEELAAFREALGGRFRCFVKEDSLAQPGETIEDDILIRADKNPNSACARSLFGDASPVFTDDTDLVLVWGEGWNFGRLPRGAKIVYLNSYLAPENGHADVFLPISIQTERAGHYTNFAGVLSHFEPCFPKKPSVGDAEAIFIALAAPIGVPA